jgi:chemotaxis protein methyltransferase CheR
MYSNKLNAVNDFEVINILLKDIYKLYGYDFRNYSRSSIIRRLENILNKEKMVSINELHLKIIHNPIYFNTFLQDITVTFTEMFRDPSFLKP